MTETMGRRERKKAATRQALADAALKLFLERGYDQVGIKDIADAADVSTTTLFKHFSGKEALVFDDDAGQEAALVAAVRERPKGRSIPAALREHILKNKIDAGAGDSEFARFIALVDGTPALRDYAHRMWLRHEVALAQAIAEDIGAAKDDPVCAALARFALETLGLAKAASDSREAVRGAFALLEQGWQAAAPTRGGERRRAPSAP